MTRTRAPAVTALTFQVEVNVAAFVMDRDGMVMGRNVVDATIGFGARVKPPSGFVTDAEVNRQMGIALAPVLAAIQLTVTSLGYSYLGPIEERIGGTPTGETALAPQVKVMVPMGDGPEHRA